MKPDYAARLARVREQMQHDEVQAALVALPENVRYLTGFTGEGLLVVGLDRALVSTDGRYRVEAGEVADQAEAAFDTGGHLAGAIAFITQIGAAGLAFEADHTTYATYQELSKKLSVALRPTSRVVERLRLIKDETEVALIREAARRADVALGAFLADLQPGPSERRLALQLQSALVDQDVEPAFATIMASGPSAACPHAVPCGRPLSEGDMLKIDMGARFEGYCSDITRTLFVGEPTERFRTVYNLVLQAQQAAVAAARPGLTGRELDQVARDIIAAGGHGSDFDHGLGHGVGLQVHEGPRVSARSEDLLEPGMVVTIEPGIYLEGWGGVRIEDTVLITATGCEVLTQSPKADY
ncbi:Xaa-Pro peptidase family protein [bacterium]|nr:Xaa-Pro peptidase family protein [bacterium]